ncbi:MAG: DUF3990 domain-containing protein [Eubacteriales bacterium]|nr:DUF3990 domain-containing protein [Eubacteriales bacterium]
MSERIEVYHGSQRIIEKPEFGFGNPNNDYGLGFYCTESIDLAKEWACSVQSDGFANRYELDINDLKMLSLTSGEYNILNWLFVLLENRKFRIGGGIAKQAKAYIFDNFSIDYRNYDIIKGYRADDSYFSFANAFLNNTISLAQLERAMVLGRLGEQIVIVSEKAFGKIHFEGAEAVPNEIFFPKRLARDTAAREEFRLEKGRGSLVNESYILDIMREGWKNDDRRLQRIILK